MRDRKPTTRRSPLYTPRATELAKRTALQDHGKDLDGAFRANPKGPPNADA